MFASGDPSFNGRDSVRSCIQVIAENNRASQLVLVNVIQVGRRTRESWEAVWCEVMA